MTEIYDNKSAKKELGRRLKHEIKTRRLKYREISEGTDLSYGYISDLSNGNYFASIETLYKLSKFIDFDIHSLLDGLEYYIPPSGHKFENVVLTKEEKVLYKDLIDKEIEFYGREDKYKEGYPNINLNGYKTLPKGIKLSSFEADDSMELYGIYKGDSLTISEFEHNDEIISERIYVLNYNGTTMLRKIFVDGDYLILIPFSRKKKYEIIKAYIKEVTILGQASTATIILIWYRWKKWIKKILLP